MRRGAALVAALLLLLAASACGARTVDVDQLAGELLERVAFEDELTELDESMVAALYGVEGALEQRVYLSGGATAEEVAVFRFATEEEAQACRELLAQRLESRKTDFANYMPDEAARLENGVLMCSGCCVALCVSSGDTPGRSSAAIWGERRSPENREHLCPTAKAVGHRCFFSRRGLSRRR